MARGVAHELIFHWEKLSEHRESMCLSPVFSNFLSKIDNIWNYYSFTLVLWTTNTMLDVQVSWCIVNAFTQLWYSCIYLIRSFQKLRNMFQVVIFTLLFPPMLNNYGNWCSPTMWQHVLIRLLCLFKLPTNIVPGKKTFTLHALKLCTCSNFHSCSNFIHLYMWRPRFCPFCTISHVRGFYQKRKVLLTYEHIMSAIFIRTYCMRLCVYERPYHVHNRTSFWIQIPFSSVAIWNCFWDFMSKYFVCRIWCLEFHAMDARSY